LINPPISPPIIPTANILRIYLGFIALYLE
jgi:hypothetical protein